MFKKTILISLLCLASLLTKAQDPQFSQYYSAPLNINPALAGADYFPRVVLNYRNQWPNLDVNFTTYSFGFDFDVEAMNSGFGLLFTRDEATTSGFISNSIGLQYSYEMRIDDDHDFRMGMEAGYVMRDVNFSTLIFPRQLSDEGLNGLASGELGLDGNNINGFQNNYLNLSAGGFFYSQDYWIGLAAHNLTRPNESFIEDESGRRPIRWDLQLGYRFVFDKYTNWRDRYRLGYKEISLTPTILYKRQGSFDQLDAGLYFHVEPFVIGAWYRGIPIKIPAQGVTNHESIIGLLGYHHGNFIFGYSYDFTVSALGNTSTGGAHELSLQWTIVPPDANRGVRKRYKGGLPCPHI